MILKAQDAKGLRKSLRRLPQEKLVVIAASLFVLKQQKNDPLNKYREKYYFKPLDWVNDFVEVDLPDYLTEILTAIQNGVKKIAIRGPHSLGKTVLASLIVLWAGSVSTDCKAITTASAWRQLTKFLWPEIHKWYGRTNWKKVGHMPELLTTELHFGPTSIGFPVACTNAATIEGAHAQRVVYIYDESKTIPPLVWEASEGAFAGEGDHIQIALSTPGDESGVYYDICSRKRGYEDWKVYYVSPRKLIRAGRMSLEWAKKRRQAWGKDSSVYQNRVWGQFAKQSEDALIPLSWVELAIQRWYVWHDEMESKGYTDIEEAHQRAEGKRIIGADISRGGKDRTSLAFRKGKILTHFKYYEKGDTKDTMVTTGRIKNAMGDDGVARVDVLNMGAGVVDRLREVIDPDRVTAVNAAERTDLTDRTGELHFVNIRSAMWWAMRELLDPANNENIAIPDDAELIGDLCTPKYKETSNGKILIESKDDIKKRIHRSTDAGDACIQAFFDGIDFEKDYLFFG